MKQNYFLTTVVLLFISFIAKGQQIPNSGFENWTTNTLYSLAHYFDSADEGSGSITRSTLAQHGNYSLKLETEEDEGDLNVGYFVNFDPDTFTGGIPYTEHVDSIIGYYKAHIINQDSAIVLFSFKKNQNQIGGGILKFSANENTQQWTRFKMDTNMAVGITPDSLMVGAASSNAIAEIGMEAGSWIELDNIKFYSSGNEVTPMPNNDFEEWETITYESPDFWESSLRWDITTQALSIEKTNQLTEGNYAIKLNTIVNMEQDTIRGVITNGHFSDSWPPSGGTSITQIPDSITYDIKVHREIGGNSDNGFVNIFFKKQGIVLANYYKDYSISSTGIIHEKITINPADFNQQIPDAILFIAFNGDTPNSYMILDNIMIHYPSSKVENYYSKLVKLYPNPAIEQISIIYPTEVVPYKMQIYNLNGALIRNYKDTHLYTFNLSKLRPGLYFLKIYTNQGVLTKKLIKY